MTKQEQKILQAALDIKEYCNNQKNCEKCIFKDEESCKLYRVDPEWWQIEL